MRLVVRLFPRISRLRAESGWSGEGAGLNPKTKIRVWVSASDSHRQVIFGQILGWIRISLKRVAKYDLHAHLILPAPATTEFLIIPRK
jgi:hypothetical protein